MDHIKRIDVENVEINFNAVCRVRLTRNGRNVLRQKDPRKQPESDGTYQYRLWALLEIFGSSCHAGSGGLFEDNVLIIKDPSLGKETI